VTEPQNIRRKDLEKETQTEDSDRVRGRRHWQQNTEPDVAHAPLKLTKHTSRKSCGLNHVFLVECSTTKMSAEYFMLRQLAIYLSK